MHELRWRSCRGLLLATPRLEEFGGWSLFWHDPCSTPTYCWNGERYCHTAEAPRVYATVDFLPLFRDESGSTVYQALAFREVEEIRNSAGTVTDTIITYRREAALTSGDLDGGFEPGMRALIGVSLGDWYRLEASYFGSYSWSDSATVRYDARDGTGNLLSPFSNFGDPEGVLSLDPVPDGIFQAVEGLDFNNRASISWSSQLDNYELNVRRRVDMPPSRHVAAEMSVLVGLRYMKLRETLDYYTVSQLPDPGHREHAEASASTTICSVLKSARWHSFWCTIEPGSTWASRARFSSTRRKAESPRTSIRTA